MFPCDEIWLMPSADRPDKKMSASADERYRMLTLIAEELFSDSPVPVKVSRLEIENPQLSLTYETKRELSKRHPDDEFHFVVTSELLRDMKQWWEKGEELFNEAHFVVMERQGISMPEELPPHATIIDRSFAWIDISSTFVRGLVARGLPATPYLTPSVAKYIRGQKLFQRK